MNGSGKNGIIIYKVIKEEEETKLKEWSVWSPLFFHIKAQIFPIFRNGIAIKPMMLQCISKQYLNSWFSNRQPILMGDAG